MDIKELVGKTILNIIGSIGSEELTFETDDGTYKMYHIQDCCEGVAVEDITGDLKDLIGNPVLRTEERTSNENPVDAKPETIEYQDSFTWTFYEIATIKGSVTIRWYGESNGWYSEDVEFEKIS